MNGLLPNTSANGVHNALSLVDSQSMVRVPFEVLVVVYEYLLDLCVNAFRID